MTAIRTLRPKQPDKVEIRPMNTETDSVGRCVIARQTTCVRFQAQLIGVVLSVATVLLSTQAAANNNARIIATGGATSIEGSAGGGIVPWAILSGYADEDQKGGAAAVSHLVLDDFDFSTLAVSYNLGNRVEFSAARQRFDIDSVAASEELEQNVFGVKLRLAGDLIYTHIPQVSLGIQYKRNTTFTIPQSVSAVDNSDVDFYLAASKLWLNGPFNRSLFINGTLRATRANQIGLMGFGGDLNRDHEPVVELSAGVFINRHWVVGAEYRQKPDNLSFAKEDDWRDVFVGWFPNKRLSMVLSWASLGSIAGFDDQSGLQLSVQISQ